MSQKFKMFAVIGNDGEVITETIRPDGTSSVMEFLALAGYLQYGWERAMEDGYKLRIVTLSVKKMESYE